MWTGLGCFLILAPACVQSDRPHGATDAAQAKGDAGIADVPVPAGNDAGNGGNSGADGSQPSLDGYWELVSNYKKATGTITSVASGTGVMHFNGGVAEFYFSNGETKDCGLRTYTVQGTTITYDNGAAVSLAVTNTTLRLTTLQVGDALDNMPGDYSDFIRLATFNPDGYGTCQSANRGVDASQPSLDAYLGPSGPDGPVASGADASEPSLDGYWDLVANHDNATGTTTPVASGTAVVHYNGGVVEMYMNNGVTKGCGSNTYTVQGTTITYATGNPNEMAVTDTTLRLTTLQAGGDSGYVPVGYSDFVRLATFNPDGYGICQ
jgi:hypothetical protein